MMLLCMCSRQENKRGAPPLPVEIGTATTADVPIFIETIGNIYGKNTIEIHPQVSGIIKKIHVEQGQYVHKGDLLYTIDPKPYIALLNQAKATLLKDEATLKLAEATVGRYEELVKQDYVSKLKFDQYQSDVEISKAQILFDKAKIDEAEINLSYATIHSPIDGLMGKYNIDQGNYVSAQSTEPLAEVLQTHPMSLHFTITQSEFVQVRRAEEEGNFRLTAYLPEIPEDEHEGIIYFFDNHIDTTTGTILIKGAIPNEDNYFWPGEFVQVRLQLRVERDAVVVPQTAVQLGQKGNFVYVYHEDTKTVEYRPVDKGPIYEGNTLIYKGVAKGEKVITRGQINLRPDAQVVVVGGEEKKAG